MADDLKDDTAFHENAEKQSRASHELDNGTSIEFTAEEEHRVYRKLDWNLMPLIFVLYSLSSLDRSNLGNAKIAGMQDDIDLGGNRYGWLATIFYIACKLPSPGTVNW